MPLNYRQGFKLKWDRNTFERLQKPIIADFVEKHCPHCLKTKYFLSDKGRHEDESVEDCCEASVCYFCIRNKDEC